MLPISERFQKTARDYPNRIAVVPETGRAWTYGVLAEAEAAFARRLVKEGITAGQVVMTPQMGLAARIALWLALMRIGAIPCYSDLGIRSLRATGLKIDVILTKEAGGEGAERRVLFGQDWLKTEGETPAIAAPGGLILTSSGSTGRPKAMILPPYALEGRIDLVAKTMTPIGDILCGLRAATAGGIRPIFATLAAGHSVISALADARNLLLRARSHSAGDLCTTPALLVDLCSAIEAGAEASGSLRRIVITSGYVSSILAERVRQAFGLAPTLIYGTTEVGMILCTPLEPDPDLRPGTMSKPVPGAEVRVVDDRGESVETGRIGRLWLRTPEVPMVKEYADGTPASDEHGWHRTGDLGWIDTEGRVGFAGRRDDLINSGNGVHLPEPFEELARTDPGVKAASAFALATPEGFDVVGLAVVAGETFSDELLRARLKKVFGATLRFQIILLAELPMTEGGKVSRRALREMMAARRKKSH